MTDTTTTKLRYAGPDVSRAVALIGVVIMNYHGYLNGGDDYTNRSFAERVFDPWNGPLSTRFAATFVTVAGIGITLLTNRSRLAHDKLARKEDRWKLIRRGVLLYAFGLLIEWIWHGTILFYYGAFFIVGAFLFTLRVRWLTLIGGASAIVAAYVKWWALGRMLEGHDTSWLDPQVDSPRNLLIRTFLSYTHPLFPWLAFLCVGIVLGRSLGHLSVLRVRLLAVGAGLVAATYALNHFATPATLDTDSDLRRALVLSTRPFDTGLLYTLGTIGSSIVVICTICWLTDRFPNAAVTNLFRHAGQMTLTLYVAHVLVFNAVVQWWGFVQPTGLDTALIFSVVFWALAISAGAIWHRWLGTGPLERIYRNFGG